MCPACSPCVQLTAVPIRCVQALADKNEAIEFYEIDVSDPDHCKVKKKNAI